PTELDMAPKTVRRPMVDRADAQPGRLHAAEAGLNDHHGFVPHSHIFGGEGVIVGEEHVLAVHAGSAAHGLGIDGQPAPWPPAEVAAAALGGNQLTGTL